MAKQKRNKNVRICRKCKEEFDIRKTDYLKVSTGSVHTECYIKDKRDKGMLEESIASAVETIKEIMRVEQEEKDRKSIEQQQKKLYAKKKEINRQKDKDDFFYYLMDKYNISKIPVYFFKKVAEINSGTHYSVSKPIPYSDLLFMFKKQENYLNKIRMRNTTLNKEMDGLKCLQYDFAVIVNMYDSYLAWKREQDIIAADKAKEEKMKSQPKIDLNKVSKQSSDVEDDDILDILDDIY